MNYKKRPLIILLGTVITLLIAILFIFSLMNRITDKMNLRSNESLLNSARMIQSSFSSDLSNDQDKLETCANLYTLNDENTSLQQFLSNCTAATEFFSFSYLNMDGVGIDATGAPITKDAFLFEETALSQGKPGYSDAYIGSSGRSQITFQTPIMVNGKQTGALYASKSTVYYNKPTLFAFRENNGNAYIIDGVDGGWVLKGTGTDKNDLFALLEEQGNKKEIGQELQKKIQAGKTGTLSINFLGESSLLSFLPLENDHGWYLISILPKYILQRESQEIMELIFITLASLIILLTAVLFIAALLFNHRAMKNREQDRLYREQLFQIISANVDFAFLLYSNAQQHTEMVSDNIRFLFDLDPAEVTENPSALFQACGIPAEDAGRQAFFRGTLAEKTQQEYKTGISNELQRWIRVSLIPIEPGQSLAVFHDTTGEHHMRADLAEALQQSQASNQAKTEFFSSVSHDIRTPMNGIVGMTAIAKANLQNPVKIDHCLEKITLASDHLLMLINELLDMSRIESGKLSLASEPVNLQSLISNSLLFVKPDLTKKKHTIQIKSSVLDYTTVMGDALHLQKILLNLLSNAVKYTPSGGKISVQLEEHLLEDDMVDVIFRVEDNGIGMTEEFLERIFDPYERAEDNRLSKVTGTGLGMAITKNIVDMMGGEIHVSSVLGEGSLFTVTIPLPLSAKEEHDITALEGCSVLIADDDKDTCENLKLMLSKANVQADCCQSSQEALALLREAEKRGQTYFAVLLDWKMGPPDGIETAKKIRKTLGLSVPILLLSAYNWEDVEAEATAAGINGFLTKPIFKTDLLEKLQYYIVPETKSKKHLADAPIPPCENLKGLRILLAEDNDLNREIAEELLCANGIIVESVENGLLAVQHLEQSPPGYYDIILMDIHMPVMDGLTATREIRKLSHRDSASIPIIAMTADAFPEDIQKCRTAGMNAHIPKPINHTKLLDILRLYKYKRMEV